MTSFLPWDTKQEDILKSVDIHYMDTMTFFKDHLLNSTEERKLYPDWNDMTASSFLGDMP